MLCVIHKHMNLTSYYKTFSQKEHVFFYDFHEKKKQYKKTGSLLEITGLPAVFGGTCLFVLEEPVFLIQMISGDFQCFAEPLEVHHFPFPQEPQGGQNIRVFRQINEVFVGTAGFLLCCTFENVMWEMLQC